MLTLTQKTLVQESFAVIAPIADDAAVLFYRRLFEIDPSLQGMFRGDMAEQRKKLMQMLTAAVKGLDRLDQLVPVVQELGRRHAGSGVLDAHYDTVGGALLWTLEMGLGAGFTPETREAWVTVYGLLATTMKEAARDATSRPSAWFRANATIATVSSSHAATRRPSAANVSATTAPWREWNESISAPLAASRSSIDPEASPTATKRPVASAASARTPLMLADHSRLLTVQKRRVIAGTATSAAAIRRPSRKRTRSAASSAAV